MSIDNDLPHDWWKSAVVYQIYPRSFADSDGDGTGDLRGIIERLDYLQTLGVDVVWLGPVYRSPQDDNGYDISDYQDVDPIFGTLDDLDELIEELHRRDIRLVMDIVVNHTSDEHPWFVESRDPSSERRDWYFWRPPRPGHTGGEPGAEPNDWRAVFSGPAWDWDPASGRYYLHMFSRKQPDLDWENPQVRAAIHRMMRWWLDRGVDGFRLDVINLISKPAGLPDGAGFSQIIDGPRVHEFLAELNAQVLADQQRPLLTVGEMPGVSIEEARRYTDPQRREVDMVFQFEHVDLDHGPGGKFDPVPLSMPLLRENLMRWQVELAEVGWNSLYWDNHDQPRAVSRFGDDAPDWRERSAKTLGTVLHLMRGTPYVYQGQELGMTNTPFADMSGFRDIESINYATEQQTGGRALADLLPGLSAGSRDNARTPMQWDGSPGAGFTTGEPWIAVNQNAAEINAEQQIGVEGSVFEHYRALIAVRHDEPCVAHGSVTPLAMDHPDLWAYSREYDGTELLVLASFTREPIELPTDMLDGWIAGDAVNQDRDAVNPNRDAVNPNRDAVNPNRDDVAVLISTSAAAASAVLADGRLPGWESVVLRRRPTV